MSSLKYFTRQTLTHATTASAFTTNFRHLLPIPKKWLKRTSTRDMKLKSVRPKDRIKYWNIVPGDQIRLLGDKKDTLHEVLSINRISNRVFVKGQNVETAGHKAPQSKNYHYSRCQLFVGEYEFPANDGSGQPRVLPVFAQRLGTSKPFWNPFFHCFQWNRYATKTVPIVPHLKGERLQIPWPKPSKKTLPEAGEYDTPKEEVAKVTYTPPPFPVSLDGVIPRPPSEEEFLTALYNRDKVDPESIPKSAPVEVYLENELSNPHSRAKHLKRWKQREFEKKALFDTIVKEELAACTLSGRTKREAQAEAGFRWRQELESQRQALKKQRWKHKATADKNERKKARKERKETKQRKRLAELVLKEQPNQYIPSDLRV